MLLNTKNKGEEKMVKKIIDGETEKGRNYPVQPRHISCLHHFFDAFGNVETDISARHIVGLCKKRGGWFPFTKEEIEGYSRQSDCFNLLTSHNPNDKNSYIILGHDGRYRVTHEFIAVCFKSSPVI